MGADCEEIQDIHYESHIRFSDRFLQIFSLFFPPEKTYPERMFYNKVIESRNVLNHRGHGEDPEFTEEF